MCKFTKTTILALVFGTLFSLTQAQTWGGPGSGTINNDIWRNGNVTIGQTSNPIAPLDVRGSNIYLAPAGTSGFSQKFIGLGESGGDCNIYGMRVQRNSRAFINVGVKQPTGIQPFGADLPNSPVISWGSVTPVPAPCAPFPCINFQDAPRPLRFEFDAEEGGCGELIATMNSQKSTYQFIVYGDALASGGSWVNSDARYKKDVKTLSNSLDMIKQLRGVSYGYHVDKFPEMNFTDGRSNGFIAQELKEVVPNAVKENEEGFHAVNYDAIVPVLVEAIKEQSDVVEQQNEEIAELRAELAEIKAMLTGNGASKAGNPASGLDKQDNAQLFQNVPNPADGMTRIPVYLPQDVANAEIVITAMNGQEVFQQRINKRGNTEVIFNSSSIQSGVYTYTLIIDGQRMDSKRLAVTK